MTSARAYRAAQDEPHALGELHRYRGTRFDAEVVDAFVTAWDTDVSPDILAIQAAVRDPVPLFKRASGL
jgi:response regulator RpfG family c-di-GMP phosphodiesterase